MLHFECSPCLAADIVGAVKTEAILYDLDDTLLVNSMDVFVPAYLGALTEFMADHVEPQRLTNSLLAAIRIMDSDTDWTRTNAEVFFEAFLPPLGRPRSEMLALFDRFYDEAFPKLESLTRPADGSRAAVRWAREAGHNVVVATNPMFPRTAIEQRIRWAELEPEGFDLVTTIERSHATKAQARYYSEIAADLRVDPSDCVMVGDNWRWDVANSMRVGMAAWWIADPARPRPDPELAILGQGPLNEFVAFARRHL